MKHIGFGSVLRACALVAVAAVAAEANTITPRFVAFVPGTSISYDADFTSGELHSGDGFTIFDMGGYTGVLSTPVDWTSSAALTGSVYGAPIGVDNVGLMNVTFTYTGAAVEKSTPGATIFTPFVIGTTATLTRTDDWVSRDHLLGDVGVIDGSTSPAALGQIQVASVPDGGSTAMLLGSVLFAFGAFRRKFNGR